MSFLQSFSDVEKNVGEPAADWLWVADISEPSTRTPVLRTGVKLRSPAVAGVFFGRITEIPLQYKSVDSDQRFYRGRRKEYPRYTQVEQVTISFFETDQYDMLPRLLDWIDAVVSPDGTYSPIQEYIRDINFYAFDNRDRLTPKVQGKYSGCWPLSISPQTYSADGSSHVIWSVNFAMEDVEILTGA